MSPKSEAEHLSARSSTSINVTLQCPQSATYHYRSTRCGTQTYPGDVCPAHRLPQRNANCRSSRMSYAAGKTLSTNPGATCILSSKKSRIDGDPASARSSLVREPTLFFRTLEPNSSTLAVITGLADKKGLPGPPYPCLASVRSERNSTRDNPTATVAAINRNAAAAMVGLTFSRRLENISRASVR